MLTHSEEGDRYYQDALSRILTALEVPAFITVARWSYILPRSLNPLVFTPGGVGDISPKQSASIEKAFSTEEFTRALKAFSFTKLLVEHDQELWFHFTNEDPPKSGDRQVYLGNIDTGIKKIPIIEVAASTVTPPLVRQIIEEFEKSIAADEVVLYGSEPLSSKEVEITATLNAAIFSLFKSKDCNIRHVYFMPVIVPSGARKVVGIISINSTKQLKVTTLEPILQPFTHGIMASFHLQEVDEQRRMFSLRSAIAAIMSRNMSHNIGSHVLWHLSQDLKMM